MTRRRILHAFSTFDLGGSQSRFLRLVPKLPRTLEHLVIAMDGRYGALETYRAQHDAGTAPELHRIDMVVTKSAGIANIGAMRAQIRSHAPDRVVGYNWGAIEWALACAISGTPHLHVEDGFGPEEGTRRLRRRNMARAILLRLSGAPLIVPSSTLATIARNEWHLSARRIRLITNGIDLDSVTARTKPRAQSLFARRPGEIIVGTVAGLRPEKNLRALVRAVAPHQALRLIIVGEGAERAAITACAQALGIASRVELLGHRNDAPKLFCEFDIYAISSLTEQLPMSLLEAMAAGLPVASTEVGDVRACVAESNRALIAADDGTALSRALATLAADEALRARLGSDNQLRARQHYSDVAMIGQWAELLGA